MALSATILPDPERLHLIPLVATGAESTAVVATTAPCAAGPLCGRSSSRVHARYVRTVADIPWHGVPLRWQLQVRRCFCDEPTCPRALCAERLSGRVAQHARRSDRLAVWLRAVGFALGGEAGTRLLRVLGLAAARPTRPDTLLRQVRQTPVPRAPAPRVVGVDDWCFLRGRRYGAILVDLEQHHVLIIACSSVGSRKV